MSYKDTLNSLSNRNGLRELTKIESEKLKKLLLENYLYIQDFCDNNNLSVMLVGGSALGAVRHKGYIPWDDDFDIAMPRKDYNTFRAKFPRELGDRFILDAPNTEGKASNRFAKILIKNTRLVELGTNPDDERACIKIDLFVIENVPKNLIIRRLHGLICTALMFIAGHVGTYEEQSNLLLKAYMCETPEGRKVYKRRVRIGKLFSFRPTYKWFNTIDKVCQCKKESSLVGIPTGRKHYFGEVLPKEAFLPTKKTDFENSKVNIPGNADQYLTNLFGDYMKIPDEEDRERHFICEIEFPE